MTTTYVSARATIESCSNLLTEMASTGLVAWETASDLFDRYSEEEINKAYDSSVVTPDEFHSLIRIRHNRQREFTKQCSRA